MIDFGRLAILRPSTRRQMTSLQNFGLALTIGLALAFTPPKDEYRAELLALFIPLHSGRTAIQEDELPPSLRGLTEIPGMAVRVAVATQLRRAVDGGMTSAEATSIGVELLEAAQHACQVRGDWQLGFEILFFADSHAAMESEVQALADISVSSQRLTAVTASLVRLHSNWSPEAFDDLRDTARQALDDPSVTASHKSGIHALLVEARRLHELNLGLEQAANEQAVAVACLPHLARVGGLANAAYVTPFSTHAPSYYRAIRAIRIASAQAPTVVADALVELDDDLCAGIFARPGQAGYEQARATQIELARKHKRYIAALVGEDFADIFSQRASLAGWD